MQDDGLGSDLPAIAIALNMQAELVRLDSISESAEEARDRWLLMKTAAVAKEASQKDVFKTLMNSLELYGSCERTFAECVKAKIVAWWGLKGVTPCFRFALGSEWFLEKGSVRKSLGHSVIAEVAKVRRRKVTARMLASDKAERGKSKMYAKRKQNKIDLIAKNKKPVQVALPVNVEKERVGAFGLLLKGSPSMIPAEICQQSKYSLNAVSNESLYCAENSAIFKTVEVFVFEALRVGGGEVLGEILGIGGGEVLGVDLEIGGGEILGIGGGEVLGVDLEIGGGEILGIGGGEVLETILGGGKNSGALGKDLEIGGGEVLKEILGIRGGKVLGEDFRIGGGEVLETVGEGKILGEVLRAGEGEILRGVLGAGSEVLREVLRIVGSKNLGVLGVGGSKIMGAGEIMGDRRSTRLCGGGSDELELAEDHVFQSAEAVFASILMTEKKRGKNIITERTDQKRTVILCTATKTKTCNFKITAHCKSGLGWKIDEKCAIRDHLGTCKSPPKAKKEKVSVLMLAASPNFVPAYGMGNARAIVKTILNGTDVAVSPSAAHNHLSKLNGQGIDDHIFEYHMLPEVVQDISSLDIDTSENCPRTKKKK